MLISTPVGFISASRWAFIRPSMAGVWGAVMMTKSPRPICSSRASGRCSSWTPSGGSGTRGSMAITCMPNWARWRAVSPPMPPAPMRTAVASGRCTVGAASPAEIHTPSSCCGM